MTGPRPIPTDPKVARKAWSVPSQTKPGTVHHLALLADGSWDCTCRGFAFRDTCAHVEWARRQES